MTTDFKEITYEGADQILDRAVHAGTDLNKFVTLCMAGIAEGTSASEFPTIRRKVDKLKKLPDPFPTEEHFIKAVEKGKELEEFAKTEVQGNFPYLLNLASVSLWGTLEAAIDDLSSFLIISWPKCKELEIIRKIRGPLIDFASASDSEQAEYLLTELKQSVNASLKLGVGRFEGILNCIGLGGNVDELVRKLLFELSQVRNIIVHKAGKADRKIVESCPWLNLEVGQDVKVNHQYFMSYVGAADWYLLELDCRCSNLTDHPINPKIPPLQEDIVKRISSELRRSF